MAAQSRKRARQARNMARKTQLQGEALVLYTTRVPWPSQYLHVSVAIPIVFDRSHCIRECPPGCGLSVEFCPLTMDSIAFSTVYPQGKTSTNSNRQFVDNGSTGLVLLYLYHLYLRSCVIDEKIHKNYF